MTTSSKPSFSITPLRLADGPIVAERISIAFEGEALNESWIAPVSPPEERRRLVREFRIARLAHDAEHPAPGKFCIVARRASPGQPAQADDEAVGFAVWEAPVNAAGEKAQPAAQPAGPSAAAHPILLQHVRTSIEATLTAMRVRVWGESSTSDFWCLSSLAVNPACQGQGVGSMLVEWGCARADAEGKDAYVESTEAGLKTYQRAGFVAVTEERDGVDGWMEFEHGGRRCAMVRRARPGERAA